LRVPELLDHSRQTGNVVNAWDSYFGVLPLEVYEIPSLRRIDYPARLSGMILQVLLFVSIKVIDRPLFDVGSMF
jgi:hypothetical protein